MIAAATVATTIAHWRQLKGAFTPERNVMYEM